MHENHEGSFSEKHTALSWDQPTYRELCLTYSKHAITVWVVNSLASSDSSTLLLTSGFRSHLLLVSWCLVELQASILVQPLELCAICLSHPANWCQPSLACVGPDAPHLTWFCPRGVHANGIFHFNSSCRPSCVLVSVAVLSASPASVSSPPLLWQLPTQQGLHAFTYYAWMFSFKLMIACLEN